MSSFELNKFLGAILGTCLVVVALNITAGALFAPETPAKPGIAPELGDHNDAALAELGYSPAEVADLRARKII